MDENEADIQQKIQERLIELPQDVQDAVASADLEKTIQEIGAAHQLHIDQIQELWNFTMLVMLGFAKAENFKNLLIDQVHIPPDAADTIEGEISQKIFLPIRESMKAFARGQEDEEEAQEPLPNAGTPIVINKIPEATAPSIVSSPAAEPVSSPKVDVPPPYTPSPEPPKPAEYKADPYRELPI